MSVSSTTLLVLILSIECRPVKRSTITESECVAFSHGECRVLADSCALYGSSLCLPHVCWVWFCVLAVLFLMPGVNPFVTALPFGD